MATRPKLTALSGGGKRDGAPEMPDWLSPMAKREWERVVPSLYERAMVNHYDSMALASYCELAAEFQISPSEFPAAKLTQMRLLLADFGMTPTGRAKMAIPDPEKKNTFMEIMGE